RPRASSNNLMLWVLRGCFGAIMIGMAWVSFDHFGRPPEPLTRDPVSGVQSFIFILALGVLVVTTDILVRNKEITTISAVYFGLLMGLLLGNLFSVVLEPFVPPEWGTLGKFQARGHMLKLLVTLVSCYLSISVLLQTKDEF